MSFLRTKYELMLIKKVLRKLIPSHTKHLTTSNRQCCFWVNQPIRQLDPRDDYAQTLAAASYLALHALTSKSTVRLDIEAEVVLDHRFVLKQFGGRWPSTHHVHLAKNVAARTRAKVSKRCGRKCVAGELAHARNAHRTGHSRRWSPGNNAV